MNNILIMDEQGQGNEQVNKLGDYSVSKGECASRGKGKG